MRKRKDKESGYDERTAEIFSGKKALSGRALEKSSGKNLACRIVLDYYIFMDGRITYLLRLSILVLYCVYAVSPVYLTSAAGRGEGLAECGHGDINVTCGIVWINVLLSELVPTHLDVPTTAMEPSANEHDREFILVKNKRAVLRERVQLKPALVLQAACLAADVPLAKPFFVDASPHRPNFRYDDLLTFCHGGLSPPVSFA